MFSQAQIRVPIIGIVENMSYFTPAELPENKYYIFGKDGGKKLAEEYDIPFLGQIPLVPALREGGDAGVPIVVSDPDSPAGVALREAARELARTTRTSGSPANHSRSGV